MNDEVNDGAAQGLPGSGQLVSVGQVSGLSVCTDCLECGRNGVTVIASTVHIVSTSPIGYS